MSSVCNACKKTVYPLEKIEANAPYHKACFRCSNVDCKITLNLKSVNVVENTLYCAKHTPQQKHTQVVDSVANVHAMNAPKKVAEGLKKVTVGTGEKANYGLDAISNQTALNAPKKTAEGLAKIVQTTETCAPQGLDSLSQSHIYNAPKVSSENLGYIQKGDRSTDALNRSVDQLKQDSEAEDAHASVAEDEALPQDAAVNEQSTDSVVNDHITDAVTQLNVNDEPECAEQCDCAENCECTENCECAQQNECSEQSEELLIESPVAE